MTALLSILTSGAFGSALGSLFQWLNRTELLSVLWAVVAAFLRPRDLSGEACGEQSELL